jgi:hypothetical protein
MRHCLTPSWGRGEGLSSFKVGPSTFLGLSGWRVGSQVGLRVVTSYDFCLAGLSGFGSFLVTSDGISELLLVYLQV